MASPSNAAPSKAKHVRLADMPVEQMNPLLDRQFAFGEHCMIARLILRAGCIVPMHSHPNEQLAYVLEGTLKFTVGGEEIVVRAGEILVIPSNVPHGAEALEHTIDLDVFSPPRTDWINGTDTYLRK